MAFAGTVLIGAAGLAVYLLGWPPVNAGAWRKANPFIVCATLAGWSLWCLAAVSLPLAYPTSVPVRPESYRHIIRRRLLHTGRWAAAYWVTVNAIIMLPAAFVDLVLSAVPGLGDGLWFFSFTAHQLRVLAAMVIAPSVGGAMLAIACLYIGADIALRLWPADKDALRRFGLASAADPVVRPYSVELKNLGRRLVKEDVARLGKRIELKGSHHDG